MTPTPSRSEHASESASTQTLAEAKASSQRVENDIVAILPKSDIKSHSQQEKGAFLTCGGDRKQWGGGSDVEFNSPADVHSILDLIANEIAEPRGWTHSIASGANGEARISLRASNLASYVIGFDADHTKLRIASFSECIAPPPNGQFPMQY
jgi:hypothetical protein